MGIRQWKAGTALSSSKMARRLTQLKALVMSTSTAACDGCASNHVCTRRGVPRHRSERPRRRVTRRFSPPAPLQHTCRGHVYSACPQVMYLVRVHSACPPPASHVRGSYGQAAVYTSQSYDFVHAWMPTITADGGFPMHYERTRPPRPLLTRSMIGDHLRCAYAAQFPTLVPPTRHR